MSKIPFLNHVDLLDVSELQNAILHKTTSGVASTAEGKIIYDTGSNIIKYYNGSAWISLTGDGTKYDLLVPSGTTAIRLEGATESGNTNDDITITGGTNVTVTRTSATELTIASTDTNTNQLTEWTLTDDDNDNTTIAHGDHVKFVMATGALGTNTTGSGTDSDPYLVTLTSPDTNIQLSDEQVQDKVGAMVTNNTETRINVTYDDTTGTLDFVVDDMNYTHPTHPGDDINVDTGALTGATVISDLDFNVTTDTLGHVTDANATVATRDLTLADLNYTGDADANNYSLDLTKLNAVTSAMTENDTLTFGDIGEDTQVTIKGNLTVTGTQTVNNVVTVSTSNGVQFEGTAADGNDATLVSVVAGSDKTYTLPNITGYIPILTNDPGTTAVSATVAELNQLDGVTVGGTSSGDIVTINGSQTLTNKTIAASQVTEISNLTAGEGAQLENINSVTITNTQWGYLGALNQGLTSTSDVAFNSLDIAGNVDVDGTLEADAITVNGATLNSVIDGRINGTEFKGNFPSSASSAGDTLTITHNLGTRDVIVQFYANVADITGDGSGDVTQYEEVKLSTTRATTNTITVVPLVALAANSLRVLVKEL